MKIRIFLTILILVFCSCISKPETTMLVAQAESSTNMNNEQPNSISFFNPVKVLFIGSSYTATYDVPGTFKKLSEEAGKEVIVDKYAAGGVYLEQLAERDQVKNKISLDQWDYVIFQGGCINAAYPTMIKYILPSYPYHPILPALIKLNNMVKNNHPESKSVYMMPWAFKDGMLWVAGQTDDYFDMQEKIYNNTLEFLDELDLIITPVGWVWNSVMEERPEIELFSRDYNHQSKKGTYLTVCTIYVTIFKERLDNVSFYNDLLVEEVYYMQETASNIVLKDLRLWNIMSSIETGIRE